MLQQGSRRMESAGDFGVLAAAAFHQPSSAGAVMSLCLPSQYQHHAAHHHHLAPGSSSPPYRPFNGSPADLSGLFPPFPTPAAAAAAAAGKLSIKSHPTPVSISDNNKKLLASPPPSPPQQQHPLHLFNPLLNKEVSGGGGVVGQQPSAGMQHPTVGTTPWFLSAGQHSATGNNNKKRRQLSESASGILPDTLLKIHPHVYPPQFDLAKSMAPWNI